MSNPAELRLAADSLLRVLGVSEASSSGPPAASPPAHPPSAPAPAPPAPVTHLSQLLAPSTIAALARLDERQRADTQAAEAEAERAWEAWEANAGMGRPEAHDAPTGSALAAAGAPHDPLAWVRPDPADLTDVRLGYGDGPTY